jgi:hypothetical protein
VTFHGIKVIWTVVGVGVVGRFDMEGGEGCFVLFWFCLVWSRDPGKGRVIENSINYKAYYKKVYNFYYKYAKYTSLTANWRDRMILRG